MSNPMLFFWPLVAAGEMTKAATRAFATGLGVGAVPRTAPSQPLWTTANSVRLELQADFLAGVWARHNHRYLDRGDIEEALRAANQIGDDAIQARTQGKVVPHAFTHGTSEQRTRWFGRGLESGRIEDSDTFEMPYDSL